MAGYGDVVCEEEMLDAFAPGGNRTPPVASTTTKVCIFGNSHIAALRLATRDRLFSLGGTEFVFWGLPGHRIETITYRDGVFSTPLADKAAVVSGGRYPSLPARDFDAFLFHGAQLLPRSLRDWLLGREPAPENMPRAITDWLVAQPLYALARSLRGDFNGPIILSPAPFQTEHPGKRRRPVDATDAAAVQTGIRDVLATEDIGYLGQPPETVTGHLYTPAVFHSATPSLAEGGTYDNPNARHMNGAYGAAVLTAFTSGPLSDAAAPEMRIGRNRRGGEI